MALGREQSLDLNITISSGSGTGTLTPVWALARWVRVTPVNETDTYDLTIKDGKGRIMLKRTTYLGTFSEKLEMSLGIMKSIVIANAAVDGTYAVNLDAH